MLPADTLEARLAILAQSPKLRTQIFAHITYGKAQYPLHAFHWGDDALPMVCIVAGVHGDEPGSTEAALRLLEVLADGATPLSQHRLLVLPCVNPSGLADGTRSNLIGQDINRQFHTDSTQESAAVRGFLKPKEVAALIDLHTDAQVQGFYLFELRRDGVMALAEAVLKALTDARFPLEDRPFYAGHVGHNGLFAPTKTELEDHQRTAPGQSLGEWGWTNAIPRCYALEAPYLREYERSAAMLVTAIFALFASLEGPTAV